MLNKKKKRAITLEELFIEMMPFSDELSAWCKANPEFLVALKNIHADKFISLMAIVTSCSPNFPDDEVIGIYTYDYQGKNPVFKQDFIVNKGKLNQEFLLFTRNPAGSSRYVKDINEFFTAYGKGGYYTNSHHLSLEDLPAEIRERGKQAIRFAEKMKGARLRKVPQDHIDKIYKQLKVEKSGKWYIKKKLKKD